MLIYCTILSDGHNVFETEIGSNGGKLEALANTKDLTQEQQIHRKARLSSLRYKRNDFDKHKMLSFSPHNSSSVQAIVVHICAKLNPVDQHYFSKCIKRFLSSQRTKVPSTSGTRFVSKRAFTRRLLSVNRHVKRQITSTLAPRTFTNSSYLSEAELKNLMKFIQQKL